jgi:hypothetical protein
VHTRSARGLVAIVENEGGVSEGGRVVEGLITQNRDEFNFPSFPTCGVEEQFRGNSLKPAPYAIDAEEEEDPGTST